MEIKKTRGQDKYPIISWLKSYCNIAGEAGKFPELDGLRAVAIFLVLLRHGIHFWEAELTGPVWNIFYNGWIGVDLFFVLSGFLISYHLLSKWPKNHTWPFIKNYFKKRALRILPLYIAIIVLVFWKMVPYYMPYQTITAATMGINIFFLQDYLGSIMVLPLWSLAVEEKFYLVAPLLIIVSIALSKKTVILSVVAIICLQHYFKIDGGSSISYSNYFWVYRAPFHFSVSGILCGFLTAYIYLKCSIRPGFRVWVRVIAFLATILVAYFLLSEPWLEKKEWNMASLMVLLCSISFSIIIFSLLVEPLSSENILRGKIFRFGAKLAYPLYLCHITVIPLSLFIVSRQVALDGIYKFILFFGIYIVLSFMFSAILHLFIEKPFLKMKDQLNRKVY